MPSSALWAVDLFGRVHVLSTAVQSWELCRDTQLEFKRVSAATQCCWGLACDHQVYVRVRASAVPIRRQEEAYENQVGAPVSGSLVGGSAGGSAPESWQSAAICLHPSCVVSSVWGQSPHCALTKAGWPGPHKAGLPAVPGDPGWACPPLPAPPLPAPRGAGSGGIFSALWGRDHALAGAWLPQASCTPAAHARPRPSALEPRGRLLRQAPAE